MALSRDGTVVDRFGGRADLARGLIRCVGQPEQRFSEDALRMFRAVRFAAQLGFELTEQTVQGIGLCASGTSCLAAERVRTEVEKTLCAPKARMARELFRLGLMTPWIAEKENALTDVDLSGIELLPSEPVLRWAGLCAALLRSGAVEDVGVFLTALRSDGHTLRACVAGQELLRLGVPADGRQWRHALARFGEDGCRAGAAMWGVPALEALEEELAGASCVTVNRLALSGGDLARLGLRGEQIGAAQKRLLSHVLDHPQDNRYQRLLELLQEKSTESIS
jgi:tRNA nucleotidyltransferase (CCA-adding enzyme)